MITPNYSKLLIGWSAELQSRADRIRNLIGDRHWPTDGRHKEMILGETISRYLPSQFSQCSGFIAGNLQGEISPEIDLYIADHSKCPALHNECGVQVTNASSVVATIEVKSNFNSAHLRSATDHLAKLVNTFSESSEHIWNGLFFFGTDLGKDYDYAQTLFDKIHSSLSYHNDTGPCVTAILGVGLAFYVRTGRRSKLRYFPTGELTAGLWLLDMLSWVIDEKTSDMNHAGLVESIPELGDISPIIIDE